MDYQDKLLALRPDEDNATPLYLQFSQKLAAAINAGVWRFHPVTRDFQVYAHGTSTCLVFDVPTQA